MRPEDISGHHRFTINDVRDSELRTRISDSINLMDNTHRGTMGEVLVAWALGGRLTDSWGDWDVELKDGGQVEVKTAGRVQAWQQTEVASLRWGIAPTEGWVKTDAGYESDPRRLRRSDIYVFAVHVGVQPDRLDEWYFYVVATRDIDRVLPEQKSISESSLVDTFGVVPVNFDELADAVAAQR